VRRICLCGRRQAQTGADRRLPHREIELRHGRGNRGIHSGHKGVGGGGGRSAATFRAGMDGWTGYPGHRAGRSAQGWIFASLQDAKAVGHGPPGRGNRGLHSGHKGVGGGGGRSAAAFRAGMDGLYRLPWASRGVLSPGLDSRIPSGRQGAGWWTTGPRKSRGSIRSRGHRQLCRHFQGGNGWLDWLPWASRGALSPGLESRIPSGCQSGGSRTAGRQQRRSAEIENAGQGWATGLWVFQP
jgi:hypothetical protein